MLVRQLLRSLGHMGLAGGALVYALYAIHTAWGLVILAWAFVAGFRLLINVVDLLTGGKLRRGEQRPGSPQEAVIIRRVILEEITPVAPERSMRRV